MLSLRSLQELYRACEEYDINMSQDHLVYRKDFPLKAQMIKLLVNKPVRGFFLEHICILMLAKHLTRPKASPVPLWRQSRRNQSTESLIGTQSRKRKVNHTSLVR
jgi:hypothetical protein